MRSLKFRIGGAAAVAMLATAVVAADPTLSADLSGKVVEADLAHLGKLVDLAKTKKVGGRVKSASILLALYAQDQMAGKDGAKMAALRDAALKIAGKAKSSTAVTKDVENFKKDVEALAKASGGSADAKPVDIKKIIEDSKLELHEAMDLFGASAGGGMNLEKDIQAMKKDGVKSTAAAELIGARTALLADLTLHLPNEKAAGAAKKQWDDYTKEMKKFSLEIATEAAKGAKANLAAIKTAAGKLDASCTNCHNKFRAD